MKSPLLFSLWLALLVVSTSCATKEDPSDPPATSQESTETAAATTISDEDQELHKADPVGGYGAGIALKEATPIHAILSDPATWDGKIVQVKGQVAEVCPRRGCWINLVEPSSGEKLRVKVPDGEIVFPLSAKDHMATVEGIVERIDLTEEQHRAWEKHLAEERGEAFDSTTVSGPATLYQLQGLGARIEDS